MSVALVEADNLGGTCLHRGCIPKNCAAALFVAEEIAGLRPMAVPEAEIPRVAYCESQLAWVGLTAEQAAAAYGADGSDVVSYNLAGNARARSCRQQGS